MLENSQHLSACMCSCEVLGSQGEGTLLLRGLRLGLRIVLKFYITDLHLDKSGLVSHQFLVGKFTMYSLALHLIFPVDYVLSINRMSHLRRTGNDTILCSLLLLF